MKAVNLHFLTRSCDSETMSMLFQSLAALPAWKQISPHEAACLRALTDALTPCLQHACASAGDWLSLLDGFFFSYTIAHIGKEFDLLKISSDGSCALNIELKSEDIGEDRIRHQLEQNRYYLSHTAGIIYSFTFVMETGAFYSLNEKGYFRQCTADDVAAALCRPALRIWLSQDIDRFFQSSDYLISPVTAPEKFLQNQYFLTNQQFDFRRRILSVLEESAAPDESGCRRAAPVISVTGAAGTGKTLLLFDLALHLSRKSRVLLLHAGALRQGHLLLDERLKKVDIRSAGSPDALSGLSLYACMLIDEADELQRQELEALLGEARRLDIPVILTYDPHRLLDELLPDTAGAGTVALIEEKSHLSLSFSGNIRINRPVYTFLRTLFFLKDHAGHPDYSCIEVLYAGTDEELAPMLAYYDALGYIRFNQASQEYEKVLIVMDEDYAYDDALRLYVKSGEESGIRLLYEGLSRTRESLCLIVKGNMALFQTILKIKLQKLQT